MSGRSNVPWKNTQGSPFAVCFFSAYNAVFVDPILVSHNHVWDSLHMRFLTGLFR